jgi:chromosome segregation ATPase
MTENWRLSTQAIPWLLSFISTVAALYTALRKQRHDDCSAEAAAAEQFRAAVLADNDNLRDTTTDLQKQVHDLWAEVGRLNASLAERDKRIARLDYENEQLRIDLEQARVLISRLQGRLQVQERHIGQMTEQLRTHSLPVPPRPSEE